MLREHICYTLDQGEALIAIFMLRLERLVRLLGRLQAREPVKPDSLSVKAPQSIPRRPQRK